LWHWADGGGRSGGGGDDMSLELSLADVERLAQRLGFEFESRGLADCDYMVDQRSMLRQAYRCARWTARKPLAAAPHGAHAAHAAAEAGS
jgi:hypothetical protein